MAAERFHSKNIIIYNNVAHIILFFGPHRSKVEKKKLEKKTRLPRAFS